MNTTLAIPHPRTVRLSLRCIYIVDATPSPEREATAFQKRLFLETLERTRGTIFPACEKSKTPRSTFYFWFKNDPDFKRSVDEIRILKPEILEDRLYIKAMEGNVPALMFLLKHMHKDYRLKSQEGKKETTVHIHHHATAQEKTNTLTLEDLFDNDELLQLYLKKYGGQTIEGSSSENSGE